MKLLSVFRHQRQWSKRVRLLFRSKLRPRKASSWEATADSYEGKLNKRGGCLGVMALNHSNHYNGVPRSMILVLLPGCGGSMVCVQVVARHPLEAMFILCWNCGAWSFLQSRRIEFDKAVIVALFVFQRTYRSRVGIVKLVSCVIPCRARGFSLNSLSKSRSL